MSCTRITCFCLLALSQLVSQVTSHLCTITSRFFYSRISLTTYQVFEYLLLISPLLFPPLPLTPFSALSSLPLPPCPSSKSKPPTQIPHANDRNTVHYLSSTHHPICFN
ncbi:uncharacterized protein BO97DRAFT_131161 [Aspergillus homomorphus CBS 101889]|uniref:Secreted protein n=1 Tax=Aspergillus homomorphus (strain CBS 101889) TaxID=1450537 RepID=A0A395IB27_ASPHC|nr:hypothetical protein BO97DRAFT_131161 [Aspergillus homomorphus CBS 101889]RAL16333.1 hypothetical protein BO97DRAFT_131161 [Aspergillus homomorphus CBS 101889]